MSKIVKADYKKLHCGDISWIFDFLKYNKNTGIFIWKKTFSDKKIINKKAGCDNGIGYIKITIGRKRFYAHRLAWYFVHKKWPKGTIDHINGNRSDNRIKNLRDVSHRQNCLNAKVHRNGRLAGASYHASKQIWTSSYYEKGKKIFIGRFKTEKEAHKAYFNVVGRKYEFAKEY